MTGELSSYTSHTKNFIKYIENYTNLKTILNYIEQYKKYLSDLDVKFNVDLFEKLFYEKFGNDLSAEQHHLIRNVESCYLSSSLAVSLAKKYDSGWACLHWPKDYGGRDASPMERVIWGQEESKFKVPGGFFEIGQGMAGPVLMSYATEEQKKRYLPPMAKGEEIWCQLFSEPGAGSDLAGIKTKAE